MKRNKKIATDLLLTVLNKICRGYDGKAIDCLLNRLPALYLQLQTGSSEFQFSTAASRNITVFGFVINWKSPFSVSHTMLPKFFGKPLERSADEAKGRHF